MAQEYPKGTLFVAVSDSDQTYAGYDGGPQRNGKGRWRKGEVGEWQADYRVPLAKRNPDDGLIWKGWLERVIDVARKDNGTLECLKSEPIFERMPTAEQRTKSHFEASQATATGDEPNAVAADRARTGGTSIKDVLTPNKAGRKNKGAVATAISGGDNPRVVG